MNGRITLDTNILIYAFDMYEGEKHELCAEILRNAAIQSYPLPLQAIGEFYVATTRRHILTRARAMDEVEHFIADFETFPPSSSAYLLAAQEAARGTFSYWDAVMLASAHNAGCDILLSEDMTDGARLGAVTVRNPFGPRGLNEEARAYLAAG
jgi:predicted nucleic acid-binding protein